MSTTKTTTPTITTATPDPQGDGAQPDVVADPSATVGVDFMTLIEGEPPGDYSEAQIERILANIDEMSREFARIVENHRALRESVVARLKTKSKPAAVIQFGRRKERDPNR